MIIENAQYYTNSLFPDDGNVGIKATINGVEYDIPIAEGNKEYDEIMRQVESGDLTIADAE
jgi:hypothetical protein